MDDDNETYTPGEIAFLRLMYYGALAVGILCAVAVLIVAPILLAFGVNLDLQR